MLIGCRFINIDNVNEVQLYLVNCGFNISIISYILGWEPGMYIIIDTTPESHCRGAFLFSWNLDNCNIICNNFDGLKELIFNKYV